MDLVLSEAQKKLPGTGRDFRMRLEWGLLDAAGMGNFFLLAFYELN